MFSTWGALTGLAVAIILIVRKSTPPYALVAGALVDAGVPAISAAAMLHAGGTIVDALPHGSFFHATAGAVGIGVKERLRLFPYGALVGLTTTLVATGMHLLGL